MVFPFVMDSNPQARQLQKIKVEQVWLWLLQNCLSLTQRRAARQGGRILPKFSLQNMMKFVVSPSCNKGLLPLSLSMYNKFSYLTRGARLQTSLQQLALLIFHVDRTCVTNHPLLPHHHLPNALA